MNADWWTYVVRIAETDEQKTIADDSGIGTTVISRWFKGHNTPSAKLVVAFARAYQRPPVEALVAAGYLTEAEVGEVIEIHRGVADLSDDELLAEVGRRMKGARNGLETSAATDAPTESQPAQEASIPNNGEDWATAWTDHGFDIKGPEDPSVSRTEDGEQGQQL